MGILYDSSMPSKSHVSHDPFSIVNDRSCISFTDTSRSSCYSRTVNSVCHSFLPLTCHVGHSLAAANHRRPLPAIEDQVTITGRQKAKDKRHGFLILSAPITVCCGAATQNMVDADPRSIRQSRFGARRQLLTSPLPESAASIDHKRHLKLADLRGSEITPQQ